MREKGRPEVEGRMWKAHMAEKWIPGPIFDTIGAIIFPKFGARELVAGTVAYEQLLCGGLR